MLNRNATAGQSITLRAKIIDDLNEAQEGTSVYVHIFEPDVTDFSLANAHTVSGVPTYKGDGVWEYLFAIPNDAVSGYWLDYWEGVLPYQAVSGLNSFNVVSSAGIEQFGAQLRVNNIVEITIASGVMGTDGSVLESDIALQFLTVTDPAFTDVRKIRLEIGAFIQDVEDDDIQASILEASLHSEVLKFLQTDYNTELFLHARREYTTCLASKILIDNVARGMNLKGKSLGDLSVQYDPTMIIRVMDKLDNCMMRWEGQVIAAGGARAAAQPRGVVKGELDPDRPAIGRTWDDSGMGGFNRRIPAANVRQKPQGSRRYKSSYFPFATTPGWKRSW